MQRRRLLLAIGEVVFESGLEGASVGAICERVGMSRRTFYEIFEDREACFLGAFELAIERVAHDVLRAYERESSGRAAKGWRERVRVALTALLECFDAEPWLARLCVVETLKAGPVVLERRRQVLELLGAAIDEGRRESKRGTGPVPLAAEAVVGGALSVIHARLLAHPPSTNRSSTVESKGAPSENASSWSLLGLRNPLMSMIVHPYLGASAAERELDQPLPQHDHGGPRPTASHTTGSHPFRDLPIRFTYRTARVLSAINTRPGASNREVGQAAGVPDQGQMSKLLARLQRNGLIQNHGTGPLKGEPNAWQLTPLGQNIQKTLSAQNTTN